MAAAGLCRASLLALLLACLAPAPSHGRRLLQEGSKLEVPPEMPPPSGSACPPAGFDSVAGLDLARFTSGAWYVQQQIPVAFEPADVLYCVRASFSRLPQHRGAPDAFQFYTYANRGEVNGPAQRTSDGSNPMTNLTLVAQAPPTDATGLSKLTAGIGLPQLAPSPYWVVALEPNYQWAIVTGGPPSRQAAGGCAPQALAPVDAPEVPPPTDDMPPPTDDMPPPNDEAPSAPGVSSNGLWLYSRAPVDPAATAAMRAWLAGAGLDTSQLLPVAQEGCRYEGALP